MTPVIKQTLRSDKDISPRIDSFFVTMYLGLKKDNVLRKQYQKYVGIHFRSQKYQRHGENCAVPAFLTLLNSHPHQFSTCNLIVLCESLQLTLLTFRISIKNCCEKKWYIIKTNTTPFLTYAHENICLTRVVFLVKWMKSCPPIAIFNLVHF